MKELLSALADGAIAVTPNRRLARRLHAKFDAVSAAKGRHAWRTPTILPYSSWLATLWESVLALEGAAEPRMLLSATQGLALWQRVIEDSGTALADVRGAAVLAADAWTLVHAWGVGGQSWRSWRQQDNDQDPSLFAAWADAYLARTRRHGLLDSAQAADAIAAQAAAIGAKCPTILIVGFIELTPQQTRLFAALEHAGAALRRVDSLPVRVAHTTRMVATTPRDEIAAALAWARDMVVGRPQAKVGIVVENLAEQRDAVLALARDILDPASILPGHARGDAPFEMSLGVRLATVPLIGTALDLIALSDAPLAVGAAATLLRTAYLPDADSLWARHAALERQWLEQGVGTISLGDAIASFAPFAPRLASRWIEGRNALRAAHAATPREWTDVWRGWLDAAGWPGTRPLDSGEFQARDAWERLLAQYASLGAVAPRLSSGAATAALDAMANEILFQPEGSDAPIQILGVLEGAGLDFDALWVAGLSADRWPAAPRPNPLLPIAWQRERGVPRATAQRELEYARMLTERFARAADEVVFSWATGLDDPPLSPSALLLAYPESAQSPLPDTWSVAMAESAALERLVDERAPPLAPGSAIRGGARAIQTQSDCPFQAVARHRLGARSWPASKPGLAAFERGQLAHATLAAFWSAVVDHARLLALDTDQLDSEIATAVEKGLVDLAAVRWRNVPEAVRAAESRRLNRLLRAWLDIERARPPFSVAAVEARRDLALGGIGLRMRVDRIDALEDGGVAIIDYKTGVLDQPAQWFDDRPRASQLGTYTLAQRASEPQLAVRAVVHGELRTASIAASGLAADPDAWPALTDVAAIGRFSDWRSLEAWWEAHLGALATELATGVATVTPRSKPSPCRNCGLQALCRIDSVRFEEPEDNGDASVE